MKDKLKIFLSYAKEDVNIASRLYHDLKQAGMIPWMDCEDILPGQNWRTTIRQVIHDCSFFLALLSSKSVSKKGFVQKELKIALEILEEFPESDIFIIPVRIDDCKPNDEVLEKLHWVNLFPSYEKGFHQVLRVFKTKDNSILISEKISQRPYKFLDAFTEENSVIFFGRDQDISKSLSKIVSHQFLLLYGKSGVGKTSLIRAGLIPRLIAAREYLPVYTRILTDPHETIIKIVRSALNIELSANTSLYSFLNHASKSNEKMIILFIDQFEVLFTQIDSEERFLFIKNMGEIYADDKLKIKIVLSFREDFLAELYGLSPYIPEIFHNQHRLERLTSDQAKESIIKPALMLGLTYEDTLIQYLLADLGGDMIEPPQLQIVCDRLYETLSVNEKCFTFRQYEQLGKAGGILSTYLEHVIKRYPIENRAIIQSLLKSFVSSVETKSALTVDNISHRTGFPVDQVTNILTELIEARLIRYADSEIHYELSHEYLVSHIHEWFSENERELIKSREMLDQGLTKWKRFHLPLYTDEMAIVDTHRERLNIEDEALPLLIYSSIFSDHSIEYWINCGNADVREKVLIEAIESDSPLCRIRTAKLIKRYSTNQLKEKLGERMLGDPDIKVRQEAALSLFQIDTGLFISYIVKGLENTTEQRERSLESIVYVEDSISEELKFEELKRFNLKWLLRRLRLKQNRSILNTYIIHAAVSGAIGAGLGGFLGYFISGIPDREIIKAVIMPASAGLLLGAGIGAGIGTSEATGERSVSVFHSLSSGFGGGIPNMFYGLLNLSYPIPTCLLGLVGGFLYGAMQSLILTISRKISSSIMRLMLRILVATITGIAMGLLIGNATKSGLIMYLNTNQTYVGYDYSYGFCVGLFVQICMILGLELAERMISKRFLSEKKT